MVKKNFTRKDLSNKIYQKLGFSNSLSVCEKIVKGSLIEKIKKNIG